MPTPTLYGCEIWYDRLLTVDTETGAGTVVGAEHALGFLEPRGMAYDPNTDTLYCSDTGSDQLFVINRETGIGTPVGDLGYDNVDGLAYDPNTDTLYGSTAWPGHLLTINTTTGEATAVGPIGFQAVPGLAYDVNTDTLYGSDFPSGRLLRINTETGVGTPIGSHSHGWLHGLAFDSEVNVLYGIVNSSDSRLLAIDETTGQATTIGQTGFSVTGLACVPEPSSLIMLAVGGVSLLAFGLRRKRRAAALLIAGVIVMVGVNPIFADIVSWHASSGVLPDDPSIPAESRFNVTGQQSVMLHDRDYLEVSDTIDSFKVAIRKNDTEPIQANDSWACQVELRMNSHDRSEDPDFGMSFGIEDLGRSGLILVAKDRVAFFKADDWYEMDTTDDFHVYRIIKDLPTVSLFVDSFETPVLTIPYNELRPETEFSVEMAESSSLGTTNFDVRSFAYNLNGTAIPEPSTAAGLLCAAIALLGFAWRRRSSKGTKPLSGG